jgi:crossover junction endodeoxyribonuclease RuvC
MDFLSEHKPDAIVIEQAYSRPKQSAQSTFNYGVGFGVLVGCCFSFGVRLEFANPASWKREMGLTNDKKLSLDMARRLFPGASLARAKDHGVAEALLLAYWLWKKTRG